MPAEDAVKRHGKRVLNAAREKRRGERWTVSNWLTKQAESDPKFKVPLFRLVDVLPRLQSSASVLQHTREYMSEQGAPAKLKFMLDAASTSVARMAGAETIVNKSVVIPIEEMGRTFIAGQDATTAAPALRKLWQSGVGFSVDLLGEAVVRKEEADASLSQYASLIDQLPDLAAGWAPNLTLENDHLGIVPRANVSVKLSSMLETLDPVATEKSIAELKARLRPLLIEAGRKGVHVNFDMEEHKLKDLTLRIVRELCEEVDFSAGYSHQAYLRSTERDAQDMIDWARASGRIIQARLVKGAYWDHETIHAEQMGWPTPVWSRKVETDAAWERTAWRMLTQYPREPGEGGVTLALGTHNARSIGFALAALEQLELKENAIEVQNLRGMAGGIRDACAALGLRTREYVPIGQVVPGMSYLVRRLLENTSNQSWLLNAEGANRGADDLALLASPHAAIPVASECSPSPNSDQAIWHELSVAVEGVGDGKPFVNEPSRDFSDAAQREGLAAAIERRSAQLLKDGPPAPAEASAADADDAVARAVAAAAAWAAVSPRERAAIAVRVAAIIRERRDDVTACIMHDTGKGWADADAETAEGIDFPEYYAREAVQLCEPQSLGKFVGEENTLLHRPRGVAVVIAPWNFPFAILCGMTVAALVTGNPVIMKPAEQTPATAEMLHSILLEAGAPPSCVQLLHGRGEVVGEALTSNTDVATILFTGSKDVGLHIAQKVAAVDEGLKQCRKVIAEMGGKNAIIVDESADMDEAVQGVVRAAFGFQGQKCSAASRVVVHEAVYDEFLERLEGATRDRVVGDPRDPATDIGPMIDADARAKSLGHVADAMAACQASGHDEAAENGARLVFAGVAPTPGAELMPGRHYVPPHIFAVNGDSPVDLWRSEVFGPVLAVAKAREIDHAIDLANDSDYKLTGALYSRTPSHIEAVRKKFKVGNLYINRDPTGALVGRQPFGGGGMSGVGPEKAGGKNYLPALVEPYVVCENTQRRGFAPGMVQ
eukprot:PRCOL_00003419-RA